MRCSCPECDTYMVHSESGEPCCICPNCFYRCTACLGTNTVISREDLLAMKKMSEEISHRLLKPHAV